MHPALGWTAVFYDNSDTRVIAGPIGFPFTQLRHKFSR